MNARDINPAPMRQTPEYKARRLFNVAAILLLLSFLLFLCQLINVGTFRASASGLDSLPVSIRADSLADYSRDTQALSIPPISENILRQIITDLPGTGSPQDRIGTLQVVLSLPVPTMTPDSRLPVTFTPTGTIGPIPSRTPSYTPSKTRTPTSTFTPTKSLTPAGTPTPAKTFIPTNTVTSTLTLTLTLTSTLTLTPTATLTTTTTPTNTTTALSTDTPTPTTTPMDTPTVTTTPTDTPTVTSTPMDTLTPTNTPSCALTSDGINISGQEIDITITNNGGTLVTITSISVNWPDTPISQNVKEVKFNGVTIVNSSDPQPPSDYPSESNWTGAEGDRELAASDSKLFELLFQDNLQSSGYSITITFDNGCTLNKSN